MSPKGVILDKSAHSFQCFEGVGRRNVGRFGGNCSTTIIAFEEELGLWAQRQVTALPDTWWLYGKGGLWSTFPRNWKGLCTRVIVASVVSIIKRSKGGEEKREQENDRMIRKRQEVELFKAGRTGGVYIDAIGQPRNIPNEYKARSETGAGVESFFFPVIGIA